jgi:predicted nucleic acid-binding protein
MKAYFADTSYFIALLTPQDSVHQAALRFASSVPGPVITTSYVLIELCTFFSKPPFRANMVRFVEQLHQATMLSILPADQHDYELGWQLFRSHADKSWSLTDCISFGVMREKNILDALTTDHHFEQAGFSALLKQGTP